jgi:hypothetical protein
MRLDDRLQGALRRGVTLMPEHRQDDRELAELRAENVELKSEICLLRQRVHNLLVNVQRELSTLKDF